MPYQRRVVFFTPDNDVLYVTEFARSSGSDAKNAFLQIRSAYLLHFMVKSRAFLGEKLKKHEVAEGDAFLLIKNKPYAFVFDKNFDHYWIGFDGNGAEKLLLSMGFPTAAHLILKNSAPDKIADLLASQIEVLAESESQKDALSLLLSLLPYLSPQNHPLSLSYEAQAKSLIDSAYPYKMDMQTVAKRIGITEKHLCKLFKNAYGIPPRQYLMQKRMERARELLPSSAQPLKQIAENVGFPSPFAFSAAYKKHFGHAPSEERNTYLNERNRQMKVNHLLPTVPDKRLPLPHFPNQTAAAVFRLWETAPAEDIARALLLPLETINETAEKLGLPPQKVNPLYRKRGYITTIRNAWHVLSLEQIERLLNVDTAALNTILKEEDFLYHKLGDFKPATPPITNEDEEDKEELFEAIRNTVKANFSNLFDGAQPFDFFNGKEESAAVCAKAEDGALRMIYSYCGLYANVLDEDISLSFPEALLARYQAVGVNAVWLPVVLYQMTEFPFDPSLSRGASERRKRLRELIALGQKYGIKIFLYLNEPRSLPLAFFEKHPDLLGRKTELYGALCTSDPRVLSYVREAVRTLCTEAPGLGGFVTITQSENLTHCKSRPEGVECPHCKDRPAYELISEILTAISEESRAVDPSMLTIAWNWSWHGVMNDQEIEECIARIPREVIIQSNSEARKPFVRAGVSNAVRDYSMSVIGPSDAAKYTWELAKKYGHESCAKLQINCTWECSTLPFLPVFDLIREHMANLSSEGVQHLLYSWTLGGYPSVNLKIASACLTDSSLARYREILKEEYGDHAAQVEKAASIFSEAFREFPFDINSIYHGPQNPGPSNLLYEKPSGFSATMTCYSYDSLDKWRGPYSREIYRAQWKTLSEQWKKGLAEIAALPSDSSFRLAAECAYTLFRSSYLQIDFIMNRDADNRKAMIADLEEEREIALFAYQLMQKTPLFGFEAANHYYFNRGMLMEKVISCEYLLGKLRTKKS